MSFRHQIFWNIPLGSLLLYSLTIIAWAVFFIAFYRRARLWAWGKGKEPAVGGLWKRSVAFLNYLVFDLLLHRRFFQDLYPAIIHLSIFTGFFLLFLGTVAGSIDHYVYPFLTGRVYLVTSLVLDLSGLVLLLGVALAAFRRYIQRPSRLDNKIQDSLALLWLALMSISGFLTEGARLAVPEPGSAGLSAAWMPAGALASRLFLLLSPEGQPASVAWHRWLWWVHSGLGLAALVYVALSFSRLVHILVSSACVFFRYLEPKGALNLLDLETASKAEDSPGRVGLGDVQDLSWKHILELDACTRCGRCQVSCPAHLSGKALNPKKVIQDLKRDWLRRTGLPALADSAEQSASGGLIPGVIQEQVIWDCTTCFACHQQCPVYIQPMYKIVEMRRHQVMVLGQLPPSAQAALQNMQKRGHPWAGSQFLRLREDWTKEVPVRKIGPGEKAKTLLFVGCTGALVERNVAVTLSLVRLLNRAGVEFGVLGGAESCCGDPARRMGYEFLYQSMAQAKIEAFKEYGIQQIITTCPHCYNTFKNEYPALGGKFTILHHSEVLASLLQSDRLKPSPSSSPVYTYHDPCYLTRYNDLFTSPRNALRLALGARPREMSLSRYESFCCGGGGGHAWLEEAGGRRINEMRVEQAMGTGASLVSTACPYCLQMLENGVERKTAAQIEKGESKQQKLVIMDIAEIVEQAGEGRQQSL